MLFADLPFLHLVTFLMFLLFMSRIIHGLIDRALAAKRRQSIITAFTTLPQGWVSTCKHQYMTVITTT